MNRMRVLKRRSLQTRLTLLIVCIATLVFAGYAGYSYSKLERALREELFGLARLWARQLAESVRGPLWDFDRTATDELVASTPRLEKRVYSVVVRDERNEKIAGVQRDESWNVVPLFGELAEREFLWSEPVVRGGEKIGEVEVVFTGRFMRERIAEAMRSHILALLFLNLALIISLILRVRKNVVLPLRDVVSAVDRIASGDLETGVPVLEEDEIGRLGTNVNKMRLAIKGMTETLRRAKVRAEENEARLRTLGDNLPGGLVYQLERGANGKSRKYTYISAGVEDLYGVSASEALEDPSSIYERIVPEDRERLKKMGAEAMAAGIPMRAEIRVKPRSGGTRWLLVSSAPRKVARRCVVWDGIEIDITERKRAEQLLAAKNKELEQLVYVASHDLRSPLVNIDGYGRELGYSLEEMRALLETEDTKPEEFERAISEMTDSLRFIRGSAQQMDSLLKGLLRLSRSGRAALNIGALDMNSLVGGVLSSFAFEASRAGVELRADRLPPCAGDEVQVTQVFSNLVGNAMKFLSPSRPGVVSVSGRPEKGEVVYCVEDNGIGIAPEHREKIFELFHRLNPSGTEGEGLGLSIVQRVLERMDGSIRVESEPGKGSSFFVSLPAAIGEGA